MLASTRSPSLSSWWGGGGGGVPPHLSAAPRFHDTHTKTNGVHHTLGGAGVPLPAEVIPRPIRTRVRPERACAGSELGEKMHGYRVWCIPFVAPGFCARSVRVQGLGENTILIVEQPLRCASHESSGLQLTLTPPPPIARPPP
eukprot:gene18048-biopygen17376